MLLDVLRQDLGNLLLEWDGQLLEGRVLEEGRMRHNVLDGVLGDGGAQLRKVPLEHHGVLIERGDGTGDLGGRAQVGLGVFAPGFQEISGDLVELGRV